MQKLVSTEPTALAGSAVSDTDLVVDRENEPDKTHDVPHRRADNGPLVVEQLHCGDSF